MVVRRPFLVVSVDCGLGHSERLHAIRAGVIGDVTVQLVSRYHSRGDGEAPLCTQRSETLRKEMIAALLPTRSALKSPNANSSETQRPPGETKTTMIHKSLLQRRTTSKRFGFDSPLAVTKAFIKGF